MPVHFHLGFQLIVLAEEALVLGFPGFVPRVVGLVLL